MISESMAKLLSVRTRMRNQQEEAADFTNVCHKTQVGIVVRVPLEKKLATSDDESLFEACRQMLSSVEEKRSTSRNSRLKYMANVRQHIVRGNLGRRSASQQSAPMMLVMVAAATILAVFVILNQVQSAHQVR